MSMGACKHFTGIQHDACRAGVAYDSVRVALTPEQRAETGAKTGAAFPCLAASPVDNCPSRVYPTRAEIAAEVLAFKKLSRDCATVREAIVAKEKGRRAVQGQMPCPVCPSGTVRYTIAGVNGHVWARCSTEDCVRFME